MTRVMDGVRPTSATAAPLVLPRRSPVNPVEPKQRATQGMDGVRRVYRVVEVPAAKKARMPTLRGPHLRPRVPVITWPSIFTKQRLAMAGMAVVALIVSVTAVHIMSSPKTSTASAESSSVAQTTPTPTPSAQVTMVAEETSLQQLLATFIRTYQTDGKYNIVVKDLSTGATASINPDESYMSASLYKLFVADQIYHMIDTKQLTYADLAGGGSGNTIGGCLDLMITISDNTCGRALGSILGWGAQNPALASEGFTETDLTTPQQTSARDVALLLDDLYTGTLDSPASNASFMNLLKNQKVNDRLPQGLPAGTVIAHKTGNLDNVVHDAGIVFGPKTNYEVVVMSGGWDLPGNAPPQFAALSKQLWDYFEE
jgi:beta-lactamase class A